MKRILYILALLFATLQTLAQSTTKYEYDEMYRLTKVTYPNGVTIAYTYDQLGNRLSKKVCNISELFIPGDVNDDTKTDIDDVIALANYLVGKTSDVFIQEAADLTEDKEVDITDLVKLIDIIIGDK